MVVRLSPIRPYGGFQRPAASCQEGSVACGASINSHQSILRLRRAPFLRAACLQRCYCFYGGFRQMRSPLEKGDGQRPGMDPPRRGGICRADKGTEEEPQTDRFS